MTNILVATLNLYQKYYEEYQQYDERNQAEFISNHDQMLILIAQCIIVLQKNQIMTPFYSVINELTEIINSLPLKVNQPMIHATLVILSRLVVDQNILYSIQGKIEDLMFNISKLLLISLMKQLNITVAIAVTILQKLYKQLQINTKRMNNSIYSIQEQDQKQDDQDQKQTNQFELVIQQNINEYQSCDEAVTKQWQQIQQITKKQIKIFDHLTQCYYISVYNKIQQHAIDDLIIECVKYMMQLQVRLFKYQILPPPQLFFSQELIKAQQALEQYIQQTDREDQKEVKIEQLNQQIQQQQQKLLSFQVLKNIRQETLVFNTHISKYIHSIYCISNNEVKPIILSNWINNSIFMKQLIQKQLYNIDQTQLMRLCKQYLDQFYLQQNTQQQNTQNTQNFILIQFLNQFLIYQQNLKYKLSIQLNYQQQIIQSEINKIDITSFSDLHVFKEINIEIDSKDIISQINQILDKFVVNEKFNENQSKILKICESFINQLMSGKPYSEQIENLSQIMYNIIKTGLQMQNDDIQAQQYVKQFLIAINELNIKQYKYKLFMLMIVQMLKDNNRNQIQIQEFIKQVQECLDKIQYNKEDQLSGKYLIQPFDQQISGLQLSMSCSDQILKQQKYIQQKQFIWIEEKQHQEQQMNKNIYLVDSLVFVIENEIIKYQNQLQNIAKKDLQSYQQQYNYIISILNLLLQEIKQKLSKVDVHNLIQCFQMLQQQIIINIPQAEFYEQQLSSSEISKSQDLCIGQAVFNLLQNPADITYVSLFYYLQCLQLQKYKDSYTHISPQVILTLKQKINTFNSKLVIYECINELLELQSQDCSEDTISNSIFTFVEQGDNDYLDEKIIDKFKYIKDSFFIVIKQFSQKQQFVTQDVQTLVEILFGHQNGLINNINKQYKDYNNQFYRQNSLQVLFQSLNQILIDESVNKDELYQKYIVSCLNEYYNNTQNKEELLQFLQQQTQFYYKTNSYDILQIFIQNKQEELKQVIPQNRIDKNRMIRQQYQNFYEYLQDKETINMFYDIKYLQNELEEYNNQNTKMIKLYKFNELESILISKSQTIQFKNQQKQMVYLTGQKPDNIYNYIDEDNIQIQHQEYKLSFNLLQDIIQKQLKQIKIQNSQLQRRYQGKEDLIQFLDDASKNCQQLINIQLEFLYKQKDIQTTLEQIQLLQYLIQRPLLDIYKQISIVQNNQQYLYLLNYSQLQSQQFIIKLTEILIQKYNSLFTVKEHNQLVLESMYEQYLEGIDSVYQQLQQFQQYLLIQLGDEGLQFSCIKTDVQQNLLQSNKELNDKLVQLFMNFFMINKATNQQHLIIKQIKLFLIDNVKLLVDNLYLLINRNEDPEFQSQKYDCICQQGFKQQFIDQVKYQNDQYLSNLLIVMTKQENDMNVITELINKYQNDKLIKFYYNKNYKQEQEQNQLKLVQQIMQQNQLSENDIKQIKQYLSKEEQQNLLFTNEQVKQQWYELCLQDYKQTNNVDQFINYTNLSGEQYLSKCFEEICFEEQQNKQDEFGDFDNNQDDFEWQDNSKQLQLNWNNIELIISIPDFAIKVAQYIVQVQLENLDQKQQCTFCNLLMIHIQCYLLDEQSIDQIISNIIFNITTLQQNTQDLIYQLIELIIEIYPKYQDQLQEYLQEEDNEDEINLQFTSFGKKK